MSLSVRCFAAWLSACLLLAACVPPQEPQPTQEPVTLRFAVWGSKGDYQALADLFHEEHPNITVEVVSVSFIANGGVAGLYKEFDRSDVIRADLFLLTQDQFDQSRPLDDFLSLERQFPREDIYPHLMDAMRLNRQQLAIPAGINPIVMFYEKARFDIAGATPPGVDYTLDEFIAAASDVHQTRESSKNEGKFSYGFCTAPITNDPSILLPLFGGAIFDSWDEQRRPTLNRQENIDAINWYTRLWSEHNVAPPITSNPNAIFQYYSASFCGFWINLYDELGLQNYYGFNVRRLPLPRSGAPGERPWQAGWDGYFIPRASQHAEAAWQWIMFLMDYQEASVSQIPPRISLVESEGFAGRVSPDMLAIAKAFPKEDVYFTLQYMANAPSDAPVTSLFIEAVQKVVKDGIDPRIALTEAQAQAEQVFSPGFVPDD
jgi:ABC-type glycerol-3-phosphate transport system substrate-binding protein